MTARVRVYKMNRIHLLPILIIAVISYSFLVWEYLKCSSNVRLGSQKETNDFSKGITNKSRLCTTSMIDPQVEDILRMNPIPFLPEYKNPCWKSENDSLRCLPYFQLIGMDKSGSSDLFSRLTRHPLIFGNSGVRGKEATWWSWHRYGLGLGCVRTRKFTFDDYLDIFNVSTKAIANIVDNQTYHRGLIGDGTPMDMWDFRGWTQIPQNRGLDVPAILTPHLIKHINPNVKLIVILRNPVDRLYSDFHFLQIGYAYHSPETFDIAVDRAWGLLKNCLKDKSMRWCLYDHDMHAKLNDQTRLHLGFYSIYIKEWLAVFPREQFFIIRTEDFAKNLSLTMQRLLTFLGVDNLTEVEMKNLNITSQHHAFETFSKKASGPMLRRTRHTLLKIYQPYNEELAKILNDKAYEWQDHL